MVKRKPPAHLKYVSFTLEKSAMSYSHNSEKRLPADVAMEIIAICDGDLKAVDEFLASIERFIDEIEPTGISEFVSSTVNRSKIGRSTHHKPFFRSARSRKTSHKQADDYLDFDTSGGLTGVLDCDYDVDTPDTPPHVRSEQPRWRRAA